MAGCFWNGKRKSKRNLGINGLSPTSELKDEEKDEPWFDSRLVFESDSDDDFKSVNGDSLPSSFGYSYSNPGTPPPSFASLKERTEKEAPQNGVDGTHATPQNEPTSPEERKTLKDLFTHKPDVDKKPESENTQLVSRQSSSKEGQLQNKASQKCFPGLLSSVGISMKKSPSSPEQNKSKATQPRLPFRLCVS